MQQAWWCHKYTFLSSWTKWNRFVSWPTQFSQSLYKALTWNVDFVYNTLHIWNFYFVLPYGLFNNTFQLYRLSSVKWLDGYEWWIGKYVDWSSRSLRYSPGFVLKRVTTNFSKDKESSGIKIRTRDLPNTKQDRDVWFHPGLKWFFLLSLPNMHHSQSSYNIPM